MTLAVRRSPGPHPGKPIKESKVALVSSGGLYYRDDRPFDLDRERKEPLWGDSSFREIPRGISQQDIRVAHLHYENSHALEDFNCVLPLAVLEDMLDEGRIGGYPSTIWPSWDTSQGWGRLSRETVPRMAERLVEMDVDLVLLSSG